MRLLNVLRAAYNAEQLTIQLAEYESSSLKKD